VRPLPLRCWLLAGVVLACGLPDAASGAAPVTHARWLMGTLWTASADGVGAADAIEAALDTVAALERRLSNWSDSSELSRLNAAGGGEASGSLYAVLDSARALAAETGGAFDPTVESLTLAWDLRGEGRVPGDAALAAARARVGWQRVTLDRERERAYLNGTRLDLGGIAKGFALDHAAAVLASRGITGASLDAGGQWLRLGGEPCSVWVADPERRDRAAVLLVLAGGSLSTSGQSEHSIGHGRHRIGHVLDPRSGRPLATRASVSVFARSGTRADALSTALLVMGRERARAFAASHRELGVLWLEPRGARVTAESWNLEAAAVAPFVTLVPSSSASLARNPSLP
jgi:thiamine biosynthesis lipoprotein